MGLLGFDGHIYEKIRRSSWPHSWRTQWLAPLKEMTPSSPKFFLFYNWSVIILFCHDYVVKMLGFIICKVALGYGGPIRKTRQRSELQEGKRFSFSLEVVLSSSYTLPALLQGMTTQISLTAYCWNFAESFSHY